MTVGASGPPPSLIFLIVYAVRNPGDGVQPSHDTQPPSVDAPNSIRCGGPVGHEAGPFQ